MKTSKSDDGEVIKDRGKILGGWAIFGAVGGEDGVLDGEISKRN